MKSAGSRAVLIASALVAGLFVTSAAQAKLELFDGVVLVPPAKTDTQFKRGKAVKYRVATAKRGFEWSGSHSISAKVKWPDWSPPATMRKRRPELPAYMRGGPENPLGARAIYLGSSIYCIHGTSEPASIGKSASSGCIRMPNADASELFRHVRLGATVTVV